MSENTVKVRAVDVLRDHVPNGERRSDAIRCRCLEWVEDLDVHQVDALAAAGLLAAMTAQGEVGEEVTKHYLWAPEIGSDSSYYVVVQTAQGFEYRWREFEEPDDTDGQTYPTIAAALYAAAENWTHAGSGGDLAKRLRLAARAYS